jgi:hypothetical protein
MAIENRAAMPGVRRYEDLEAWQLADKLKREVYALTASGAAAKDFEFRNQIRASAASSTKNIAEGFGSIQCSTKYIVYLKRRALTWGRRRKR